MKGKRNRGSLGSRQHGRRVGASRMRREMPRPRLTPITAAVLAVLGAGGAGTARAAGNVITPDGRTATRLHVHGTVTDVTTGTVHGADAFNAFTQFREAQGRTVNLHLPKSASNLVNLVYGGRTVIDGVLNAYRAGKIGGNVAFADPYGLLVGQSGVINVGSLSVSTPTKAFMNRMLGESGQIDGQAVAQFLDGQAPLSPDGRIDIAGHVNASGGIALSAAQVLVADTGRLTAGRADRARGKLFRATVNTQGLQQGTQAVEHNGVVRIVGAQSATVAGGVEAHASDGGAVSVTAAQVDVGAGAHIDTSGPAGGGQVWIGGGPHGQGPLAAAQTTAVHAGARIDASATSAGNGGHVVVWSEQGTRFAGNIAARGGPHGGNGGQVEVSAAHGLSFHGQVDTGAPDGSIGTLLLDPDNLYVVNTAPSTGTAATPSTGSSTATVGSFSNTSPSLSPSYVTVAALQNLGDTNITLKAFDQITIGGPSGASANVDLTELTAKQTLTLEAGYFNPQTKTSGSGEILFNSGSSITTGGASVILDAGAGFTDAGAIQRFTSTTPAIAKPSVRLGEVRTGGGDLTVNSSGPIQLDAALDTSGGSAGTVTLTSGYRNSLSGNEGIGGISFGSGASITTGGGSVVLDAGTGFAGAYAKGASVTLGNITTNGGDLQVNSGHSITLPASDTLKTTSGTSAGAVDLAATQEAANASGLFGSSAACQSVCPIVSGSIQPSAKATVDVSGTITAGDVKLSASASSDAGVGGNAVYESIGKQVLGKFGLSSTALVQAYRLTSSSTATVTVHGTAKITGTRVELSSDAKPTVTWLNDMASRPTRYLAAVAAFVNGTSKAQVNNGATITLEGTDAKSHALDVSAKAEPGIAMQVADSLDGTGPALTLGYDHANVQTSALVNAGANILQASGASAYDVTVEAENKQSYMNKATADASGTGANAGMVVALSNLNTSATATEGANLENAGDVTVTASSSTDKNVTSAETDVTAAGSTVTSPGEGSSQSLSPFKELLANLLGTVKDKASKPATSKNDLPGASGSSTSGSGSGTSGSGTSSADLGSALALSYGDQSATATIAPGATIDASGNVVVAAANTAPGFHDLAMAGTASAEATSTTTGGSSKVGVSLAAALSWQQHHAHASVGAGAQIKAARVGVGAINDTTLSFLQPYNEVYSQAQTLRQELSNGFPSNQELNQAWKNLAGAQQQQEVKTFVDDLISLSDAAVLLPKDWNSSTRFYTQLDNIIQTQGPNTLSAFGKLPAGFQQAWKQSAIGKAFEEIKAGLTGPDGMTTYAQAKSASASNLNVAGAVNYLSFSNDTQAWIAPGAKVALSGTLSSSKQGSSSTVGDATIAWNAPLSVHAENGSAVLDGAGNGFLKFFGVTPSSPSGVGVGGAFDWTDYHNVTRAWVADGATLSTAKNDVSVRAGDSNRAFSFTPSGGKGGGYAGNGAVAVTRIADQTTAEIDKAATVRVSALFPNTVPNAGAVDIKAASDLESFSLSGAVVKAQGAGVGLGVAVDLIDPSTTAGITNTSNLTTDVNGTPGNANDCSAAVCVRAGSLDVQAQTTGAVGTLAVAGAVSGGSSSTGSGSGSNGLLGNLETGVSSWKTGVVSKSSDNSNAGSKQSIVIGEHRASSSATDAQSKLSDANNNTGSQQDAQGSLQSDYQKNPKTAASDAGGSPSGTSKQPKLSLAGAGSAAVNWAQITTKAVLDDARVSLGGSGTASIRALRNTSIFAAAGAGALSRMGASSSSTSAAIAGTLGMNLLESDTEANLTDGTVLNLTSAGNGVNVQAIAGGQAVAVGLGLAVNTASGQKALASIVGSGSVSVGRDTTQALVSDSTLENAPGGAASVQAYDSTDIGTGGGAFYTGGRAGIGIALSVAMTGNDTLAQVLGSQVNNFSNLYVQAFAPAQIVSAAAVGGWGGSSQTLSLSGAVVVDELANSTEATIGADSQGTHSSVTVSSGVAVDATSQDNTTLSGLLPGAWTLPFDFTGSALPALQGSMGGGSAGNQGSKPHAAGGMSNATPGASVIALAGSAAVGQSKGSLGISAVYSGIDDNTSARIVKAAIAAGPASGTRGSVHVQADNAARVISVAVGVGATTGKLGGVGAFTINNLGGSTTATLGDTTPAKDSSAGSGTSGGPAPDPTADPSEDTTTVNGAPGTSGGPAPDVKVTASDAHTVWSAAGGLAYGGTAGAGAAMTLNLNQQQTQAQVSRTRLTAGTLTVKANSGTELNSGAVAGAASPKFAIGGSLDVTFDQGQTQAQITNSDLTLSGNLTDEANDTGNIWDGAGALSFGGKAALGIAAAVNVTGHDVEAGLTGSTLSYGGSGVAGNTVSVNAQRSGFIASGAAGGQASGKVAGGLAVVANVAQDTVQATVSGLTGGTSSGSNPKALPAALGTLSVSANDSAQIYALAGELAGSGSGALGGAVTVNWLNQTVQADLTGSTLAASNQVEVQATGAGEVHSLAAAAAVSGKFALGGGLGVNITGSKVTAEAAGDNLVSSASPDVTVAASDNPGILAFAFGGAGSGKVAAGIGVAVNRLGDTTTAAVTGGSLHAGDLTVAANSGRSIKTLAIGAAVSASASGAGSLVTNMLDGTTTADISGGAQVTALNNADITAADNNEITGATGAVAVSVTRAGLGLGVTVNQLKDDTQAYVGVASGSSATGKTTSVNALAQGTSGVQVAAGAIGTHKNAQGKTVGNEQSVQALGSYQGYAGPQVGGPAGNTLVEATTTVHGLAINAESLNSVTGLSVSVSTAFNPDGSVALDASTVTNVLGGKTLAYASDAHLDTQGSAAAGQALSVIASRHDFAGNLVLGAAAAPSSDAGASGVLGVNTFNAQTRAYLQGGKATPLGQANVLARASQDSFGLGVGLSSAIVSAAGTGMIDVFSAHTEAYAQGLTLNAQSVTVKAHDRTGMNLVSGSGTIGIGGGAAGTFLVVDGSNTTRAWVGDPSGKSKTTVDLGGGNLDIEATSRNDLWTLAVSGAGAGGVALAGQASAIVMQGDTEASLDNATVGGLAPRVPAGAVTVSAQDTTDINSYAGAIAGGGGLGVGAGANIVAFQQTVAASMNNADVTVAGPAQVDATSNKSVEAVTATAGIGGSAGIGGAVGLILLGSGSSGQALDALNKNNSGTLASQSSMSNKYGAFDLGTAVNKPQQDATTATVSGGKVTAGSVTVSASDTTSTQNLAGAAGVGVAFGFGAGIAVTRVYDTVTASVDGSQITAGSVTVSAGASDGGRLPAEKKNSPGHAVLVQAYDGAAGLGFGLGAAIADGQVNTQVTAKVQGGTLTGNTSNALKVSASDGESAAATGAGATAGAVSLGGVVTTAANNSQVNAQLGGTVGSYRGVKVAATGGGTASASATGVSAGIFSGNAAAATASNASTVTAATLGGATIKNIGADGVQILATGSPVVSATATGVSVGYGASVGASVATATSNGTVQANLADGTVLSGPESLTLKARGTPTVTTQAQAGTGGMLGVQAVVSTATNDIGVSATAGPATQSGTSQGVTLPDGDVLIEADQVGTTAASGTGVVGAALAAGAVVVNADAGSNVAATLGPNAAGASGRSGDLSIKAAGSDSLSAQSTSGAGGLGALNAAVAKTDLGSSTVAQTQGTSGTLDAGAFVLSAQHSASAYSQADSTNVSLAGGGAALAENTGDSTVKATYGSGTEVQAGSGAITASNSYSVPANGWNANGKAGGALNVNAVSATTNPTLTTDAFVDGGRLTIVGDPTQPDSHALVIGASNDLSGTIRSEVYTGGAVQGLTASASFEGTESSNVTVASGASIDASGNVVIYSGAAGQVGANALAHTWGGAGVVNSNARATLTANQAITLAGVIRSDNDISVRAGYGPAERANALSAGATSHAYNYTVLAVGTTPSAYAKVTDHNHIDVAGQVLAGGNASLLASPGQHRESATAIGKNTYQEAVQEIVNFFIGLINKIAHKTVIKPVTLEYRRGSTGDDASSSVDVTGTVEAGLAGNQKLSLSLSNGKVVASPGSSPLIQYAVQTWNYYQYLQNELSQVQDQLANTSNTQVRGRLTFEENRLKNEISGLESSGGNPLPAAESVPLVQLHDILVRSGNVTIDGGSVNTQGGTVKALGVKGVTVDSSAPAFLQVNNITVHNGGGRVDINGRITSTATGTKPAVSIDSSFRPPTGSNEIAPDIFLNGEIYNPGGSVVVQDSAGSIHNQGAINALTVSLAALNGGYFQGYVRGYHNPGNKQPLTTAASVIAGGPVYVAAAYLNVDGLIQSGHATLSVKLPSSLDAELKQLEAEYRLGRSALSAYVKQHKSDNLSYDATTGYVRITPKASISNPNIIPAFWNPANDNIMLNAADSQPGRVYLYGSIFNTGSNSRIIAAGGLADITVTNNTSLPVVVQGLNAGQANAGGLVQITDTAKVYTQNGKPYLAPNGESYSLVTEYRYNPVSGKTSLYHYGSAVPGKFGAADAATLSATQAGPSVNYKIANDGGGVWYLPSATGGESAGLHRPGSSTSVDWAKLSGVYPAGNAISIQFVGQSHGNIDVTSPAGIWLKAGVSNSTGPVTLSASDGVIGSLSDAATVTGRSVTLTGKDGIGSGALTAPRVSWYDAVLQILLGGSWVNSPGQGSRVVASSGPLGVSLVGSGTLNATSADGSIAIGDSQGGLTLAAVSAKNGAVSLSSEGDIVSDGSASPAIVSGGDLTLSSTQGSIHGPSGALPINVGGTLDVTAPVGTVNLAQAAAAGNLSVGQITAGSNVTLAAPGGSIVSALAQTTNQKGLAQLKQQWASFGLTGSAAAKEGSDGLAHIEQDFKLAYRQYWSLKGYVTFAGSGKKMHVSGLTQAGYSRYRAAAAAAKGIPDPATLTQTQILSYVQQKNVESSLVARYQSSTAELGQLTQSYGFHASQVNRYLTSEDASGFAQTVASGLKNTVTAGVSWTPTQLLDTVSQQAVFGTAPSYQTQAPNIVTPGRITLLVGSTSATGAKLGSAETPVTIQVPTGATVTLTPQQEAALAAAAPGDVTVSPISNGKLITITRYHPIYEQGASRVDASARHGLYLKTASGNLNAGDITSPQGEIRLFAQDSLLPVAGESISGGATGVVLDAVNGAIGGASAPLAMTVTGPLDSAKAGGDLYLEQTAGPLQLGNFYSGATGSITVDHGSIASLFSDASVAHVAAQHLILDTAGAVGTGTPVVPLAVTLGAGGLSGQVGGSLDIASPTADLAVHGLSVNGPVTLQATLGAMTLDALESGASGGPAVTLTAGKTIRGDSAAGADIAAPGAGAGVSLTAGTGIGTAGRYLVLNAPVLTQADTSSGDIYLSDLQSMHVGSIRAPGGRIGLRVAGNFSFGTLLADQGLDLSAQGNLSGSHAGVTDGPLTATAGGSMDIGTVSSPDVVTLTANGGDMHLGTLVAAEATLATPDDLDVHQAYIENLIRFYSQQLQAHVKQQQRARGPLHLQVEGWQGGIDRQVDLSIDPPHLPVIGPFRVRNGVVHVAGDRFRLHDAYITGAVRFLTPQASVLVDNASPRLQPADVQLYQPGQLFYLAQDGLNSYTNAFTEHYRTGYRVSVPNYIGGHEQTFVDYGGGSAYIRSMQSGARNGYRAWAWLETVGHGPRVPDLHGVLVPGSGGALNLGGSRGTDDRNDWGPE